MQKTEVGTRDSYKLYKQVSTNPIDIKTYLLIGEEYREFLISKVFEGEEVTLPAKLGTLSIIGTQKKLKFSDKGVPLLPPNWKETKKLWESNEEARLTKKLVFCLNEETSGVTYKYYWSKNRVAVENKSMYSLRMVRKHKRAAHFIITQGKEFYIKNK